MNDQAAQVARVIAEIAAGMIRVAQVMPDRTLGQENGWVVRLAEDLAARAAAGAVSTCPHLDEPCPAVTAAWRRDLVTCIDCIGQFDLSADPVADATCDVCGRVCPDGLHPSIAQAGTVLIMLGRCEQCRPGDGA